VRSIRPLIGSIRRIVIADIERHYRKRLSI
jgi:hypothetical protein